MTLSRICSPDSDQALLATLPALERLAHEQNENISNSAKIWIGELKARQWNTASQKLQAIKIADEKLEGTPKKIVEQLNRLSKKYDLPTHQGVDIRFDPAVNSEPSGLSIFRPGQPLSFWLQDVCDACGSRYRPEGLHVLIELLPLPDKSTPNLEAHLTNGMAQICVDFRSKRGADRYALGEQLFKLLPHSPVTSRKDIGTGAIVTFDYEHPSYKLYKRDIILLLGEPDRNINNETFYYSLRPDKRMIWELGVEFGKHDYAENPSLTGYSKETSGLK